MQYSGAQRRPAGFDTNLEYAESAMFQMMMATLATPAARHAGNPARDTQSRHVLMLRRAMGLAIVTSGFAVVAAQVLQHVAQHALGG
jgi:hypothetical protein